MPAEMTVTTLLEIEACPRSWALSAAHYPAIWAGKGYPPPIQLSSLAGTVTHLALEEITRGLIRAGCQSVQDPSAIQVMKDLGGFTAVLLDCIDRVRGSLERNPRAKERLESVVRTLCARVPELRTQTQTILRRMRLPHAANSHSDGYVPRQRGSLAYGAFPEVELHARRISWKGRLDLLAISPQTCEITDFKTGEPDDDHRFQIQVYALLWNRDAELNPDGRLADRLVLAYGTNDMEIPAPTAAELDVLERDIVTRRDAAHEAVSQHPPDAHPSPGHCRYCGVRHLCNEYWTADVQQRMAEDARDRRSADIELTITGLHGPSSWDAVVSCGPAMKPRQPSLLRAAKLPFVPHPGQKVRLLAVPLSMSGDEVVEPEQPVMVATVGAWTEAFIVDA